MINRLVFYIVKQTRWESKGIVKMSIDELISIIVEPLLAVIGLVIIFLQLKDDRRGKKIEESMIQKEEEERLIIADLVKHSDSYLELLNKFSEQINFINSKAEVPGAGIEMLQSIIDNGKKLCNDYSFVRNELLEIYKRILQNEERFSLSYGFDRYIEAFRVICLDSSIEQSMIKSYNNIVEYVEQHRDSFEADYLISLMNEHMHAEFECLKQLNEIKLYVLEIKLKYE